MIVLYVVYLPETVGERKYKEEIEWVLNKGCWDRGSRSLDHVVFISTKTYFTCREVNSVLFRTSLNEYLSTVENMLRNRFRSLTILDVDAFLHAP